MPKSKFEIIYRDLKQKIEAREYPFQELLPSENTMVKIYSCSRNTIRRGIALLAEQGYVQSLQGKGVKVIYQPIEQTAFTIGGIESFKESAKRNKKKAHTDVLQFSEITADERIAQNTGFPLGSDLYYIQRVRFLDDTPLIFDINIFLKSTVPGLSSEIAQNSIYEYLEHSLGMQIVTSKRRMTVEHATPMDEKYLQLGDYNSLAVVTGQTFNSDGIMFEYTQSRHHPDFFCFQDIATRH
ncbi:GntR family trehalose operon transcriptional repressor [Aequitasia blattaphilus]|uniref:Trehalose operon repressor n=1 Tax=Aequitasia blattaphilus TaxID=2949332 RepID=A0ABT1E583_9FIRM|nr:trehalose operon repressor [Aequitasia blattaphilus]MCP1100979.1 trehalose operon repressor [Aequitasia blattaphilus]MCR8613619.1 trehalose operon repressor [Aequitasia blattaphilus]